MFTLFPYCPLVLPLHVSRDHFVLAVCNLKPTLSKTGSCGMDSRLRLPTDIVDDF